MMLKAVNRTNLAVSVNLVNVKSKKTAVKKLDQRKNASALKVTAVAQNKLKNVARFLIPIVTKIKIKIVQIQVMNSLKLNKLINVVEIILTLNLFRNLII